MNRTALLVEDGIATLLNDGWTLEEVAVLLGLTRERVRQMDPRIDATFRRRKTT